MKVSSAEQVDPADTSDPFHLAPTSGGEKAFSLIAGVIVRTKQLSKASVLTLMH